MSNIEVTIDTEIDLTVFSILGNVTAKDLINVAAKQYKVKATTLVMWDFSKGAKNNISVGEVRSLVSEMKQLSEYRGQGKTVFVAPDDLHFGIMRMYQSQIDLKVQFISYRVTRTVEDAMAWLLAPDNNHQAE